MSPGAVVSSSIVIPRRCDSVTETWSGLSTSARTTTSTTVRNGFVPAPSAPGCVTALLRRRCLDRRRQTLRQVLRQVLRQQRTDGVGGTRALAQPVLHPLLIELHVSRLRARIIRADVLDETAFT